MSTRFSLVTIAFAGIANGFVLLATGVILGWPMFSSSSTQFDLSSTQWCANQHGVSTTYPCKWDSRERITTGWDPGIPPVALYVRSSQGCPDPVPPKVSCYWAPQDQ